MTFTVKEKSKNNYAYYWPIWSHPVEKLSFSAYEGMDIFGPCGRCALCGNHGSRNSMVPLMKHIRTPNGERRLKQKLNCKDYGIYAAGCKNFDNYYVGQTMTSFSQRWTKHRIL